VLRSGALILQLFEFSMVSEQDLHVTATPNRLSRSLLPTSQRCFHNELLEQKLRQTIADETKSERDLILAYAFSNTKLLG